MVLDFSRWWWCYTTNTDTDRGTDVWEGGWWDGRHTHTCERDAHTQSESLKAVQGHSTTREETSWKSTLELIVYNFCFLGCVLGFLAACALVLDFYHCFGVLAVFGCFCWLF